MQHELSATSKSLGLEVTLWKIFSLRSGYYENLSEVLGGVKVLKGTNERYLSLFEFLFSKDRGKFQKISLCFGFGLTYKGYIHFDISDDHLLYDFNTSNWKFSLTLDNLYGLIKEIKH